MPAIAAVVLAAGGSSRMGRPKVLLELEEESFIGRVVRAASDAGLTPVTVVAGDQIEAIRRALDGTSARIVANPAWSEGIGSSIRRGVEDVASADAVVILLADQPLIDRAHIEALTSAFARGADPVATSYGGRPGVPALFGARWFEELRALPGDRGARDLLDRAEAIAIGEEAPIDVDTQADYERLLGR